MEPGSGESAEDSVSTIGLDAVEETMQIASTAEIPQETIPTAELDAPQEFTNGGEVYSAAISDKQKARKRAHGKIDDALVASPKPPATVTPGSSAPSSPSSPAAAEQAGSSDSSKMKTSEESADSPKKKLRSRPKTDPVSAQEQPDRVHTRRELSNCMKSDPVEREPVGAVPGRATVAPPLNARPVPANIKFQPSGVPEATHPSVNATVKMYLANVTSTKAGEQSKGLNALHKMVSEGKCHENLCYSLRYIFNVYFADPTSVNSMRVTGALDTLLNMLLEHDTLPEVRKSRTPIDIS